MRMGHTELVDGMYRDGFNDPLSGLVMGQTAENLARKYGISRQEQDDFALRSQQRAQAAIDAGGSMPKRWRWNEGTKGRT